MSNSNYENVSREADFRNNNRPNFKGKHRGSSFGSGFRIKLSDNEMKAVKSIQETFNLKSPVAVLGFSIRILSEMIKDDDLIESITNHAQRNINSQKNNSTKSEKISKIQKKDPLARPTKSFVSEKNQSISDGDVK